jgi:phage-related protein
MESNFNTLALEFVKELAEVFAEEQIFKDVVETFELYDPKKFLLEIVGDHQALAISKDEKLLDLITIPGIDAKKLWSTSSETTKESIWAYVSTLVMLATAIDNTPKELMTGIESIATEFAEKIQKMQEGTLNMSTLFQDVLGRVQQMDLSNMEGLDVNALTQSLGICPDMISQMMGGVDPSMIQNMMGLMGGGDNEPDLLKMLEDAKVAPSEPKKQKKSKPSKYSGGQKDSRKYSKEGRDQMKKEKTNKKK